jgi:hypothetical protein
VKWLRDKLLTAAHDRYEDAQYDYVRWGFGNTPSQEREQKRKLERLEGRLRKRCAAAGHPVDHPRSEHGPGGQRSTIWDACPCDERTVRPTDEEWAKLE